MRDRAAEMLDVEEAVDGMAIHVEEDRVRHRRIVPFLGVMVSVHAVRLEVAAWRVIAGTTGRDRPDVTLRAVDRDRHLLRDRKSTRLNSSHMSISYAVFCLKKKNKQQAR